MTDVRGSIVKGVLRPFLVVAAALVALVSAVSPSPAQPVQDLLPVRPTTPGLSVALSSLRAGRRNVSVGLRFVTMLQCGRPNGAIVVTLPPAAVVPARVSAAAVYVNGRQAGRVSVSGHTITVLPAAGGITCNSITEGRARVVIGAAAGIGNPPKPGTYVFRVLHGVERYRAVVSITP